LYYYRARHYIPKIGRFISEDPIGFAGNSPNLYSYAKNSPTIYTDPSGLFCVDRFIERFESDVKQTKDALSFWDSMSFAVGNEVANSIFNISGSKRTLANLFELAVKAGDRNKFQLAAGRINAAIGINIIKGIGEGIALDFALWSGINTGALIESLTGELLNGDACDSDKCTAK